MLDELDSDESDPVSVWIARTHGRHRSVQGVDLSRPSNPSQPRFRGLVHRSVAVLRYRRLPLKGHGSIPGTGGHGPTGIRTLGILLAKEALYH